MDKYGLLQGQLQQEGVVEHWLQPTQLAKDTIQLSHDERYIEALFEGRLSKTDVRRSGFPWSRQLVERECIIMQGTILCAEIASRGGIAMNIAGGTHHAFSDRPEGFCLLNDLILAADHLHRESLASSILIVDLDVHQGNGTAEMAATRPYVYAFSMHGANNYPFRKEQSNLDIPLADDTRDAEYLEMLGRALHTAFHDSKPDVVLYQSGVDVLASDKLGKLGLTMAGCKQRDKMVFQACRDHGIGAACAMGGGYSSDVNLIVEAHMQTFRSARDAWT